MPSQLSVLERTARSAIITIAFWPLRGVRLAKADRESLGLSRRIETGKPRDQDTNVKHACKLFDHHK
jgi:hypothetical protein